MQPNQKPQELPTNQLKNSISNNSQVRAFLEEKKKLQRQQQDLQNQPQQKYQETKIAQYQIWSQPQELRGNNEEKQPIKSNIQGNPKQAGIIRHVNDLESRGNAPLSLKFIENIKNKVNQILREEVFCYYAVKDTRSLGYHIRWFTVKEISSVHVKKLLQLEEYAKNQRYLHINTGTHGNNKGETVAQDHKKFNTTSLAEDIKIILEGGYNNISLHGVSTYAIQFYPTNIDTFDAWCNSLESYKKFLTKYPQTTLPNQQIKLTGQAQAPSNLDDTIPYQPSDISISQISQKNNKNKAYPESSDNSCDFTSYSNFELHKTNSEPISESASILYSEINKSKSLNFSSLSSTLKSKIQLHNNLKVPYEGPEQNLEILNNISMISKASEQFYSCNASIQEDSNLDINALVFMNGNKINPSDILSYIGKNKKIQAIHVIKKFVDHSFFESLGMLFEKIIEKKIVNNICLDFGIENPHQQTIIGLEQLSPSLNMFPDLVCLKLNLQNSNLKDQECLKLFSKLNFKFMKSYEINLSQNHLTNNILENCLFKPIKQATVLTNIDINLSENKLSAQADILIAKQLENFKYLQALSLDLSKNFIEGQVLSNLLCVLSKKTSLVSLNLNLKHSLPISQDAKFLQNSNDSFKKLKELKLNLDMNAQEDSLAQLLEQLLSSLILETLELNISGNSFSNQGLLKIVEGIQTSSTKSLKYLKLAIEKAQTQDEQDGNSENQGKEDLQIVSHQNKIQNFWLEITKCLLKFDQIEILDLNFSNNIDFTTQHAKLLLFWALTKQIKSIEFDFRGCKVDVSEFDIKQSLLQRCENLEKVLLHLDLQQMNSLSHVTNIIAQLKNIKSFSTHTNLIEFEEIKNLKITSNQRFYKENINLEIFLPLFESIEPLINLNNLTSLDLNLREYYLKNEDPEVIKFNFSVLSRLESLSLHIELSKINEHAIKILLQSIRKLQKLTSISLGIHNTQFSLSSIASEIGDLCLGNLQFFELNLYQIHPFTQQNPSISDISLLMKELIEKQINSIQNVIINLPWLQPSQSESISELSNQLSNLNIPLALKLKCSLSWLSQNSEHISTISTLTSLEVEFYNMDQYEKHHSYKQNFLSAFQHSTQFTSLEIKASEVLKNCNCTKDFVKSLGNLQSLTYLRLNFSENDINDELIVILSQVLTNMQSLQSILLDLSSNNISNAGANVLLEVICHSLKCLKRVNLILQQNSLFRDEISIIQSFSWLLDLKELLYFSLDIRQNQSLSKEYLQFFQGIRDRSCLAMDSTILISKE